MPLKTGPVLGKLVSPGAERHALPLSPGAERTCATGPGYHGGLPIPCLLLSPGHRIMRVLVIDNLS